MKRIIAAFIAAVACSAAFAQQPALQGLYIGGHIGQAKVADLGTDDVARDLTAAGFGHTGVQGDDTDTTWKFLVGYRFHPNFAAEVAYHDLGEFSASTTLTSFQGQPVSGSVNATIETKNSFSISGLAIAPLGAASIYGKLGIYMTKLEARATARNNATGQSISTSASESSDGLLFGLGVMYDLTRNVTVRAEWERLNDVGGGDIGKSDADLLSVGLVYRF